MAAGLTATAFNWSASASKTINSSSDVVSDAITLQAGTQRAVVVVAADNQGTPASGDTVEISYEVTVGDVLGDSGDDYTTAKGSKTFQSLGTINTYGTDSWGEDPGRGAWEIPLVPGAKAVKLVMVAAQAGSRNIVVRAMLSEWAAA